MELVEIVEERGKEWVLGTNYDTLCVSSVSRIKGDREKRIRVARLSYSYRIICDRIGPALVIANKIRKSNQRLC